MNRQRTDGLRFRAGARDEDRIHISGTQQRAMVAEGAPVPREFGRPEVIEILREYYSSLS